MPVAVFTAGQDCWKSVAPALPAQNYWTWEMEESGGLGPSGCLSFLSAVQGFAQ